MEIDYYNETRKVPCVDCGETTTIDRYAPSSQALCLSHLILKHQSYSVVRLEALEGAALGASMDTVLVKTADLSVALGLCREFVDIRRT